MLYNKDVRFLPTEIGANMNRKKKIQVVIIVTALFLCGILYLALGPGGGWAESADDGAFVAGNSEAAAFSEDKSGQDGDSAAAEDGDSVHTTADGSSGRTEEADAGAGGEVYIYICGAVKQPGVYTFDHSPRIVEVVEQAGGFTKKADQSSVNLAGQLEDGAQIVVCERNKDGTSAINPSAGNDGVSGGSGVSAGSRVNINTAGLEELKTIPGIGDVKAAAIVSYRDEKGSFGAIEDLMNISGIKQGTFDKIKDYVTV